METTGNRNAATLVHLSTLTQWVFPFGNFILPIIIWSSFKNKSPFIERHGRNVINFELSLLLYGIIAAAIAIPVLAYSIFSKTTINSTLNGDLIFTDEWTWHDMAGWPMIVIVIAGMYGLMKVAEFFLVILAAVKAANGEDYQYPLTINFIKEQKHEPTISDAVSSTE
jgi:uncharacterized Tic20 family protein